MTIYSSGKTIHQDPFPFRSPIGSRHAHPGTLNGERLEHEPRPEFDRAPTNPANPILAAFREYVVDPADSGLAWCAGVWLDAVDGVLDVAFDAYHLHREAERNATGEHSNNARRVLSRLAALA